MVYNRQSYPIEKLIEARPLDVGSAFKYINEHVKDRIMKKICAVSILAVLMAVVWMLPACAPEAAAPANAPQVISFTAASDTIAEGECPVVKFEVANCSAITILQDGEIITEIEITGSSIPAAFQPRDGAAYALNETRPGIETNYCPGVYPVIYQGSSSGRPSRIINQGHTEPITETSFETQVRSQDGAVTTSKVACKIVPATEQMSDQRTTLLIIPPDCVSQDATAAIAAKINYFRIKDQAANKFDPPVFEFSVSDAGMMQITQDNEVVFYIQSFPLDTSSSFNPSDGAVYALTEDQNGVDTNYCPGVYPIGFKGASNGKPGKTVWKFGDKNEPGPSAEIKVCSPSGDVLTEMLPFFAMCPEGYDCLTQAEGSQRGCYTGTSWNASSLGSLQECGVDEYGQAMHCCPELPLPVVKCDVSTSVVPYGGGRVTVTWSSQNADTVTMAVGNGAPSRVPLNKSLDVTVTRNTCFTFRAENKASQSSTTKCCVSVAAMPSLPTYQPPVPPAEPDTEPPPPDDDGWVPTYQ
jgi:hypothetical protein